MAVENGTGPVVSMAPDYGSAVRAHVNQAHGVSRGTSGRARGFFRLLAWASEECAGRCEVVGPLLEYWHREFREHPAIPPQTRRQHWTEQDDRMLADLYGIQHLPLDEVAHRLGRTPNATKLHASEIGLRRTYIPEHLQPHIPA